MTIVCVDNTSIMLQSLKETAKPAVSGRMNLSDCSPLGRQYFSRNIRVLLSVADITQTVLFEGRVSH